MLKNVFQIVEIGTGLDQGDEFRWTVEKDSKGTVGSLSIDFKKNTSYYKRFIIEFLMVTTYRFAGWLIGVNFPLRSVHFSFSKPLSIDKYHYLLGNRIIFDDKRNSLFFDAGMLSRPVVRNQREVPAFLRSSVGWFLLNPDTYTFTRMVLKALSSRDLSSDLFLLCQKCLGLLTRHPFAVSGDIRIGGTLAETERNPTHGPHPFKMIHRLKTSCIRALQ